MSQAGCVRNTARQRTGYTGFRGMRFKGRWAVGPSLLWLVLIISAGSVGFLWLTDVPLGVRGEWTWDRIRVDPAELRETLLGALFAGLVAAVYVGVARIGAQRMPCGTQAERALWLTGLILAGFVSLSVVQQSPPSGFGMSKAARVLYYPASSGYFYTARYEMSDVHSFLTDYEDLLSRRDVLHVGTHPPGLFLLYRAAIWLCNRSPRLKRTLLSTVPESMSAAFEIIARKTRGRPTQLTTDDRAAIWLVTVFTQFIAVATVVPLYLLIRRDHSRRASWMAVCFWPLVPALAIFLPKSDALYPFIGMLFLWVWLTSVDRASLLGSLTAGLVFWTGMLLSLAMLPFGLLAAILTVVQTRQRDDSKTSVRPLPDNVRRTGWSVAWAAGGFLAAVAAFGLLWNVNLLAVWNWNYHNHAAFYAQYPRTWWKWLLVNPLEFALAAGLPVTMLAAGVLTRSLRSREQRAWRVSGRIWAVAFVWAILWISGKNMGEAARLWLMWVPCLIWMAAGCFDESPKNDRQPRSAMFDATDWTILLGVQAAVALATTMRVNGFPLF